MYCVGPIQKPRCSPFRPSRFDSVGMAGDMFATSRRGMKAAEGYIGGPEVKSASFYRRGGGAAGEPVVAGASSGSQVIALRSYLNPFALLSASFVEFITR